MRGKLNRERADFPLFSQPFTSTSPDHSNRHDEHGTRLGSLSVGSSLILPLSRNLLADVSTFIPCQHFLGTSRLLRLDRDRRRTRRGLLETPVGTKRALVLHRGNRRETFCRQDSRLEDLVSRSVFLHGRISGWCRVSRSLGSFPANPRTKKLNIAGTADAMVLCSVLQSTTTRTAWRRLGGTT